MKVVIAEFHQESNSFSPIKCDIGMFKKFCFKVGHDIYKEFEGTSTEINGFLTALKEEKTQIIPSVAAHAVSSGPVSEDVYDLIVKILIEDIRVNWPIDGVLLCLHGAMLLTNDDDGTGRFLERIRKEVGDEVAIVGTLDLHANVTEKMVRSSDLLIGYHTYPHTDLFNTGYKAGKLLVKTINGEISPNMAMVRVPLILLGEKSQTDSGPMKKVIDKIKEIELKESVISASILPTQPWLDIEEIGSTAIVVTDKNQNLSITLANDIARLLWDLKEEFKVELISINEGIERVLDSKIGPVVLSDSADGTGSGSLGDSTAVLSALINKNINVKSLITVVDSETVKEAIEIGVGNMGDFNIGGKIDTVNSKPVKVKGIVKLISDGTFTFKGPQFTGKEHHMGRTVVIKCGNIFIVVMENSAFNWDPELYRSVGLEPKDAKLVLVKSPTAFKAAYKDIAEAMYVVDAPGISSTNLKGMPFKKIKRPIYPLDIIESFNPTMMVTGHIYKRGKG